MMDPAQFVYTTYIAATPGHVWQALTDPAATERFWSGSRAESTWNIRSPFRLVRGATVHVTGEVLESELRRRLAYTWTIQHMPDYTAEGPSRVTFELEALGPQTRLTLTHNGFRAGGRMLALVSESWPIVLSSLKSFLETGSPLTVTRRRGGPIIVEPAAEA